MKNKILLIRPENTVSTGIGTPLPLSLLSLASVLEGNGFEVKIIDAIIEKEYYNKIESELQEALLVGVTALTSEIKNAIEILKFIKKKSKIPVVLGGWHATLFPVQTCLDPLVDFVIMNEGEIALLELAQALKSKKSYKKIKGLVYKDIENSEQNVIQSSEFSNRHSRKHCNLINENVYKGDIKINAHGYLDLDRLPLPAYHLVNLEKYIITSEGRRWLPYQSSRGCPHNCAFCINKVTNNFKYRFKSAEKVIKDLKEITSKYDINGILFIDDNFFVVRDRVKKICEGIVREKLGIKWRAECRADYFGEGLVDNDVLDVSSDAGLIELTIGAESGSEKMLKYMCKGITTQQIINSNRLCKKYNIVPSFSFIIGLPKETKEDVLLTLDLIKKMKKENPNLIGGIATYRPYPKSEICMELIKANKFREPKNFREWSSGRYAEIYTERILKQPWQFSPSYVENVSFYGNRAMNFNNAVKNFRLKSFFDMCIAFSSYIRMKINFYSLPIDKAFYKLYEKIKNNLYRKLIKT